MQHDLRLREAARVIYETCCPAGDSFDDAEQQATGCYRDAVEAARAARSILADAGDADQLPLL